MFTLEGAQFTELIGNRYVVVTVTALAEQVKTALEVSYTTNNSELANVKLDCNFLCESS